jgi:hypothetical protein
MSRILIALSFLALALGAQAQSHKIVSASYIPRLGQVNILFDAPLAGPPAPPPTVVVHDDNQNEVRQMSHALDEQDRRLLVIHLTEPFPKTFSNVVLDSVTFADGTIQKGMTNGRTTSVILAGLMKQVAQTQEEKNIFASGLVTSASSGTAGAGDISLNSPNVLGALLGSQVAGGNVMGAFMQLKRSTTTAGDPKNFEAGVRYQSGIALTGKAAETIPAILLDFAAKTEGTASQFGVDNLVGDTSVALQSSVWDLGGKSSAKLRIVAGAEGGSNRSKGNAPMGRGFEPLQNVDWLARGKFGFQGALKFVRGEESAKVPFDGVELTAGAVDRYLVYDELRYDQTTNAIDKVAHGHRPWVQVDLKLIIGHTSSANYGLKLTYQRGSLPPVFADVKAFQFGFLYETNDRTGK